MVAMIIGIVVVGAVALYVIDRYTKKEEIVWTDAAKIGVVSSLLTGGVVFATSSDVGTAVVDAVKSGASTASDMFVGKPSF